LYSLFLRIHRSHTTFAVILLAVFAVASVQYVKKIAVPREDGNTKSAVLRWTKQLQEMEDGANIFAKYNYPNPPVMAHLLWPLSELISWNHVVGGLVWFYLKVGMALLCFRWAFRMVESPDRPFPAWAKTLTAAAALKPILGDLSHGNINIFILFLVMASLYSFTRGKDTLCGLLLALAIACKVTPALFLVYFLWKGSWRVLLAAGVGLVLFFFVVPSLVFAGQEGGLVAGWNENWEALRSWYGGMVKPYLVDGIVKAPERENQSLPGLLTRLLERVPSFSTWVDNVQVPLLYSNVADLEPGAVKRIVQAFQVAFVLLMVFTCRARVNAGERTGWRVAAEFSLILVGMLLFSERTWKHHCVTLLLPFAVLSYAVAGQVPGLGRRLALVGLVGATLLMLSTSSGVFGNEMPRTEEVRTAVRTGIEGADTPAGLRRAAQSGATAELGLVPDSPGKFAQVYGAYVWAFLLLIGVLAVLLRWGRPARRGDESTTLSPTGA
jgi:alpha-1,2-mannosyltransferase